MSRLPRIKLFGDQVYYHLYSRTVGQEFFLEKDYQKEFFLSLLLKYSSIFFVKLISFSIMSNHFHIVVKSENNNYYTKEEIDERIELLEKNKARPKKIEKMTQKEYMDYSEKLNNISNYMKYIKQNYSIWYNKKNNRTGFLWGDRYKNVLLQPGESVLRCSAYIELNPVRASMVNRPDMYRWNSLYARTHNTSISKILHFYGIYNEEKTAIRKSLLWYRKYVYITGGADTGKGKISNEILEMEEKYGYDLNVFGILKNEVRGFIDGSVVGTESHIKNKYDELSEFGYINKKERKAYRIMNFNNLYCLRRLKKQKTT